jgi:hypothetical protein
VQVLGAESPPLVPQTLTERALRLAVPATHPPARGEFVDVADLRGQRWIAGSSSGEDRTAPPGVRVLPVRGGPQERRRLLLARLPHPPTEPVTRMAAALRAVALDANAASTSGT